MYTLAYDDPSPSLRPASLYDSPYDPPHTADLMSDLDMSDTEFEVIRQPGFPSN